MAQRIIKRTDGSMVELEQAEADRHDSTSKAERSLLVDSAGTPFSSSNRLPVDANITISQELEIKNDTGNPIPTSDSTAHTKLDTLNTNVSAQRSPTTLTGSGAALNTDLIASTDISSYSWLSLQITGTWSGTITFQGSNDNSTFISISLASAGNTTSNQAGATTTTSNGIFAGPINYKYLRVRMTSYTSGTANATVIIYPVPTQLPVYGGTTVTDRSGFTDGSGRVTPIGGVRNDTITTDPTEDQAAAVRITSKRGLHVNLRNETGTEIGTASNPLVASTTEVSILETFGTTAALASSSTATLVTYNAITGEKFKGFYGTGDRQAHYWVEVNGTKKFSYKTTPNNVSAQFFLPSPRNLTNGDVVVLKVKNDSTQGTSDFEGGILIQ